jgi:hypothetical protein
MIFELMLVVCVLALAGLAVYQSSHRPVSAGTHGPSNVATASTPTPEPNTAAGVADNIATQAEQDAAAQATASAATETSAGEVSQSDSDVSNLGGTSNVSF